MNCFLYCKQRSVAKCSRSWCCSMFCVLSSMSLSNHPRPSSRASPGLLRWAVADVQCCSLPLACCVGVLQFGLQACSDASWTRLGSCCERRSPVSWPSCCDTIWTLFFFRLRALWVRIIYLNFMIFKEPHPLEPLKSENTAGSGV